MEILQLVGFGLVATFLSMILKEQKQGIATLLIVFTGAILFVLIIDKIQAVFFAIERLAVTSNVNIMYIETILKIIGIAYIAEFGSQITKDAGQSSIASKIELGGKILILTMALPILSVVFETVLSLIPK